MKKTGLYHCIIALCCVFLSACAISSHYIQDISKKKNIEYNAILTDPVIKRDLREVRAIAINAPVLDEKYNPHFDEITIIKLDQATAVLIDRLQNHYHLSPNHYKIHTYIGTNKLDACYQYYNSYDKNFIGKNCAALSTCQMCNNYVSIVKSRNMKIIHASWFKNNETTALVDTFKLKNGDFVFLGLDLSPQ